MFQRGMSEFECPQSRKSQNTHPTPAMHPHSPQGTPACRNPASTSHRRRSRIQRHRKPPLSGPRTCACQSHHRNSRCKRSTMNPTRQRNPPGSPRWCCTTLSHSRQRCTHTAHHRARPHATHRTSAGECRRHRNCDCKCPSCPTRQRSQSGTAQDPCCMTQSRPLARRRMCSRTQSRG